MTSKLIAQSNPSIQYMNDGTVPSYPTSDPVSIPTQNGLGFPMDGFGHMGGGPTIDTAVTTLYSDFTLMNIVQMFVVYAFIIAAALSAVFIFMGGISFILSGGNEEKIKQAINTIRYSIIGLVVTILSFTFVTIVGRIFGLNFLNYLSYQDIKYSINRLISSGENESGDFQFKR